MASFYFPTFMVGKKTKKKTRNKGSKSASRSKTKSTTKKTKSAKSKTTENESALDSGIVIVEDDIEIDKEKVNEERRAYLEEARSQEASD